MEVSFTGCSRGGDSPVGAERRKAATQCEQEPFLSQCEVASVFCLRVSKQQICSTSTQTHLVLSKMNAILMLLSFSRNAPLFISHILTVRSH